MNTLFAEVELHHASVSHQVSDFLKEAIINEKLRPGDKLPPEEQIAKHFKISRVSVREALRELRTNGLVETRRGAFGGTFVRGASTEHISEGLALLIRLKKVSWRHLAQYRLDVDGVVAAMAARMATPEDIDFLKGLVAEFEVFLADKGFDWDELIGLDRRMHLALARIAGNPIHRWVLRTILDNVVQYYDIILTRKKEFARECYQDMVAMVAAVEKGDEKAASRAALAHVRMGNRYMEGRLPE